MTTMPEFKWLPDLGAAPTSTPLVTVVQFGDGYENRVSESLNRVKTSWEVVFTRPYAEIIEIYKFLQERAGVEGFNWTDPLGFNRSYVCREWNGPSQQMKGVYVLTATFEEIFEN